MKRYTCWLDGKSETDGDAMSFDATTPKRAAVAYVKFLYSEGEGYEDVCIIHVRGFECGLARVEVKCEVALTCVAEVIG